MRCEMFPRMVWNTWDASGHSALKLLCGESFSLWWSLSVPVFQSLFSCFSLFQFNHIFSLVEFKNSPHKTYDSSSFISTLISLNIQRTWFIDRLESLVSHSTSGKLGLVFVHFFTPTSWKVLHSLFSSANFSLSDFCHV